MEKLLSTESVITGNSKLISINNILIRYIVWNVTVSFGGRV